MSEPTERQVLYALVAAGFHVVTAVVAAAAVALGVVPAGFGVVAGVFWISSALWGAVRWRRTGPLLIVSMAGLVFAASVILLLR